jgi:hypothetical protein
MLLAYAPDRPNGSTEHGYELSLCLTPTGHLDAHAWAADPMPWRVRRFWPGREKVGELIRVEGGWGFRYGSEAEDEPVYDLEGRVFRPGEYVSVREPDGSERQFRIVEVTS